MLDAEAAARDLVTVSDRDVLTPFSFVATTLIVLLPVVRLKTLVNVPFETVAPVPFIDTVDPGVTLPLMVIVASGVFSPLLGDVTVSTGARLLVACACTAGPFLAGAPGRVIAQAPPAPSIATTTTIISNFFLLKDLPNNEMTAARSLVLFGFCPMVLFKHARAQGTSGMEASSCKAP